MSNGKDVVIIPTSEKYDSVMVWLHGEGEKAFRFSDLFMPNYLENKELTWINEGLLSTAKVVFPQSKKRFIFKKDKPKHMYIWYNVLNMHYDLNGIDVE
jgi:hypothetical protein